MNDTDENPVAMEDVADNDKPAEPPEPCIPIGEFEAVAGVGPVLFAGFKVWAGHKHKPLSEWRRLLAEFCRRQ